MKNLEARFITDLLTNPRLNEGQKSKIFELAIRDVSLKDNNKRILKELEQIREKIGINKDQEKESEQIDTSHELNGSGFTNWTIPEMNGNTQSILDELTKKANIIAKKLPEKELTTQDKKIDKFIQSNLPNYISPKHLSTFLSNYNQDPILKYTCHEIDDENIIEHINECCGTTEYDLLKHQELLEARFNTLEKKHFVHRFIKDLIRVYLTGVSFSGKFKTWSSEKITMTWKSKELIAWSEKNPGIVPNPGENLINKIQNRGFKFKKAIPSEITGERITSFPGLVLHFKHLFHLKGDNSLLKLLETIHCKENWNDTIRFQIEPEDFWENLELFTDVDKLLQAYRGIMRMILEVVEKFQLDKPVVKLCFKEENEIVIFSIHHINSKYKKTLSNALNRIGDSQTRLINNQINGLCDLYLKADFDNNQFAELNLWDGKPIASKSLEHFEGVMYILKFRR